jgi:polyhydroxyalkanoate synthesis regulator phasin
MAKKEITNQEILEAINTSFEDLEGKMDKRFKKLENGQNEIKLKLTNVAYRFELEELKSTIHLLTKRVKKLENKV